MEKMKTEKVGAQIRMMITMSSINMRTINSMTIQTMEGLLTHPITIKNQSKKRCLTEKEPWRRKTTPKMMIKTKTKWLDRNLTNAKQLKLKTGEKKSKKCKLNNLRKWILSRNMMMPMKATIFLETMMEKMMKLVLYKKVKFQIQTTAMLKSLVSNARDAPLKIQKDRLDHKSGWKNEDLKH